MRILRLLHSGAKLMLAAALYYSGLLGLYLRLRYAQQGVVLLYHRVLPESESGRSCSSEGIIVNPATFARHLRALRRHFTFVDPLEFEEWWRGQRKFPKPPCLISFDDGWKDNLVHAHPVLRAEGVPAVIFLPTGYIGTGRLFWQERLSQLLETLGQHPVLKTHPLVARLEMERVFVRDATVRSRQARSVARRFKSRAPDEIEAVVSEVATLVQPVAGAPEPEAVDTYLDWQDVRAMQPDGIHFGSHAVTHRVLPRLDAHAIRDELSASKQLLEQNLQRPVRALAYPNGDHDSTTCRIARETGYALAFTTIPGWITPGDDPYQLRRINIHEGAHRHTPALYASILGVL